MDYNQLLNKIYESLNKKYIIPDNMFKNISDKFLQLKKEGYNYLPSSLINGIRDPEHNIANSLLLKEFYNIPTINEIKQSNAGLFHHMLDFIEKKKINTKNLGIFSVKINDDGDYVLQGSPSKVESELFKTALNPDVSANKLIIPKNEFDQFLMKEIQGQIGRIFSKNHLNKLLLEGRKEINKNIHDALVDKYRLSDQEIIDFVTNSGIVPSKEKSNIITSEPFKRTSRNKGNPYMHFIFTGPIGEKGLNIVGKVNPKDVKGLGSRLHDGEATKGLSRKSRKLGGKLKLIPRNEINK